MSMNMSETIKDLAAALAAAQGEMENATKNAANPHFRSKYADLAEVINTVRPVLAKHGLSVSQWPAFSNGIVSVTTVLMHSSGEWIRDTASAPSVKQDAQGVGSAITYLRRYSLAAVSCIAQEDDDGNGAGRDDSARGRRDNAGEIDSAREAIRAATSAQSLRVVWTSLPGHVQAALVAEKDDQKRLIEEASRPEGE